MCSFLFTAPQMHWGMMVRYTHKRVYQQRRNHFPSLWMDNSIPIWKSYTLEVIDTRINSKIRWCISVKHTPDFTSMFSGEGRRGNKQHRCKRECQFMSSPESNYCLAASLCHRNIQRLEGRTYWRAAHNLFQFSPGKMTTQPCQMWIRSERWA